MLEEMMKMLDENWKDRSKDNHIKWIQAINQSTISDTPFIYWLLDGSGGLSFEWDINDWSISVEAVPSTPHIRFHAAHMKIDDVIEVIIYSPPDFVSTWNTVAEHIAKCKQ